MASDPQVILVVFDGMRPDLVTDENTPTLRAFLAENVNYGESRSVFPSMTRVSAAAMASGYVPGLTGVIANQFYDPKVFPQALLHTGKSDQIDRATAAYGGRFVEVDGLADILVSHGRKVAVVTSASGGTTRMLNPRVAENGQISLGLRDWSASYPKAFADKVAERFGPPPEADMPAIALTRRVTDIFLDCVAPEADPDVAILWYCDPDHTFHYRGLGSDEALAAMREVDRQLARLLDWAGSPACRRDVQIMVASDHGHLNAIGRVETDRELRNAGFDLDPAGSEAAPLVGAPSQVGAVRYRGRRDPAHLKDLTQFLLEQPWCGLVFTEGEDLVEGAVAGTFNRALILNDHRRSGDLFFLLAASDELGPRGVPGNGRFVGSELKEGGSTHGGLHPYEMRTVLGAGGSAFKTDFRSDLPSGVIDVTPTILTLLGIAPPAAMSGRPLVEGFAATATDLPDDMEDESFEVSHSAGRDVLRRRRIGRHVYIQYASRHG